MEHLLLKPDQVAEALAIGKTKTYALIVEGRIPSLRIGGSVRVPLDLLRAWIAKQVRVPPEGETG